MKVKFQVVLPDDLAQDPGFETTLDKLVPSYMASEFMNDEGDWFPAGSQIIITKLEG